MNVWRILTGLIKNHEETGEQTKDPALQTRYYNESSNHLLETVLMVLKQNLSEWKIIHVDEERGEIMLEKTEWFGINDIVISIYTLTSTSSAIDVVSAKRGRLGDFGSSYRNIITFFTFLHQEVKPN